MKQNRLTEEHGFWCIFWGLALVVSLCWDAALRRTPSGFVTLLDVTSLTFALAVTNRIAMVRFSVFRCWVSLVMYLTARWVKDWLLIVLISCVGIPVFFVISSALGDRNGRSGLIAYGILSAALPTIQLIRNVRLLRPSSDWGELWRFDTAPRWLFG